LAAVAGIALYCHAAAAHAAPPVTVTAARIEQDVSEVPTHVTVIDRDDIERSAALTVDDLLRSVPGFSLFRQQSSLIAHPTTQGVSLRGIAPSGASRTLVLLDGVPLNDAFGGWVYWSRIPTELIERIEIVRGGGSSVWGNYAGGGVIHIITLSGERRRTRLRAELGNRTTADVQAVAVRPGERLHTVVDASRFSTGGWMPLGADERGSIDEEAASNHGTGGLALSGRIGPHADARMTARYFAENRDNGTRLTGNRTRSLFVHGGVRHDDLGGGQAEWDWFSTVQDFDSTFSSQADDRDSELLALDQFDVPSLSFGSGARWSRLLGARQTLSLGADYTWVDGKTHEDFRNLGAGPTRRRLAGGRQHLAGLYVRDALTVSPRLELSAAVRLDYWRSYDGRRRERDLTNGDLLVSENFADRDRVLFSPQLGAVFELTPVASVRASAYRGFRAPTLNELYRPFRVRNDITEANAALDPEIVTGAEGGVDLHLQALSLALTGYWNRVDDAVANVTVADGPGNVAPCGFVPDGGVCRQRRNLDDTRVVGAELELGMQWSDSVASGLSYLYSDAEVGSAGADPSLDGNRLAQVPEHQGSAWVSWSFAAGARVGVQLRYVGRRYEDDRNASELGDFLVVDAVVSKRLRDSWELFVRAENVFDKAYAVGESGDGLQSLGPALLVHAGVRYQH
jgi:outer membrane receptor protein involved in Fe transport